MNRKGPRRGRDVVIGGSVIGSAIGDSNIVENITLTPDSAGGSASLDDLREAVALLRAQVEAAGGSEPAYPQVRSELPKFEEELNKDEPDGDLVRIRWTLVQKLLGSLPHVAGIAQVTDRIVTLIHTLFAAS
ncbi:MAG: hypothetical protein ACRDRT_02220 [Pseudonocardiaceae bacterium]